ncbi:hypothetical protein GW17_00026729 [Ensete ventricosum]|uniref:Uncharacterized protein n=1 Tax=Ensete ventricosum TaxID=4639 RepID=A0A444EHF9_ENSVE|nr:hypothetical protein GW17_00026729 [Ensete ventricosum]RZR71354.1 hypothetical protein BHM03_00004758 [Ensete ventricosum]
MKARDAFRRQIFGHNKPSSVAALSPPRHLPSLAAIFNQIRYATPYLFARSLQSAHPYQSLLLLLHGAIGNRGPPPASVARAPQTRFAALEQQRGHAASLCSIVTEPSLERIVSSSVSSVLKRSFTCCTSLSVGPSLAHRDIEPTSLRGDLLPLVLQQLLLLSAGHLCLNRAVAYCRILLPNLLLPPRASRVVQSLQPSTLPFQRLLL